MMLNIREQRRWEKVSKNNFMITVLLIICLGLAGGLIHCRYFARQPQSAAAPGQNDVGAPPARSGDPAVAAKPAGPPGGGSAKTSTGASGAATPASPAEATAGPAAGSVPAASPEGSSGSADPRRRQIEQDYLARLQSTASGYEARLNGLVSAAWLEYTAAKKENPNLDLRPLANKYYSAGKSLEAECDSRVYALLESFESDLLANSFPADAARQARQEYEARKRARAGQLNLGAP